LLGHVPSIYGGEAGTREGSRYLSPSPDPPYLWFTSFYQVSLANAHGVTLRFLAEPSHVNFGGKVHGGAVMKWIDQAGYTAAASWTGDYCVTACVGGIRFLQPINVGELLEVRARIIRTGTTSMDVSIEPKPVPRWSPTSPVDQALEQYAARLSEVRKGLDQEIEERLKWLDQQPQDIIKRPSA
jgi:acyl-coenzyme A thioesterase PaaI-like protein